MDLVEINQVTFSYDLKTDVLSAISFAVAAGQSLLVVGDNGSGKTTLGHLLAGLSRPTKGTIRIDGKSPAEVQVPKRCHLTSYMGQVSHLSVLTSSIGEEVHSFCRRSDYRSSEQDYLGWARRHSLPTDLNQNPRDLTTPDLWRLILGLYAIILQPVLLVIDEVFCPGRQEACVADVLNRRKQLGKATVLCYQRQLPLPFDAVATLDNSTLRFSKT